MLTALTRPRISCGVRSGTTVERITTLTMSVAPSRTSAASDSPKWRDSPNTIVATPNSATQPSRIGPARRVSGRYARPTAVKAAPRPERAQVTEAERPDVEDVAGEIGRSAAAPPSSTANRSSEIDSRITGGFQTKRSPSATRAELPLLVLGAQRWDAGISANAATAASPIDAAAIA